MSDEQAAMDALDSVAEDGGSVDQVAGGDMESTGGAGESELPEFRPFTWKDGEKELTFSRRAELTDFLNNRLTKAEAERKRAAERAQHFEKRSAEISTREQSLQEAYAKISKMDKFLKDNPQIAERIAKEMQGSKGSPELDRILEERMKPINEKLSAYEKAEQERQAAQRRQRAIARLKQTHGDADDRAVLAELNRLQEIPDEDAEYALYELLHFALRGKATPADVERKFAEEQAKKRPPSVTSTPGRGKQEPDPTKMSRSEARDYAMRMLNG